MDSSRAVTNGPSSIRIFWFKNDVKSGLFEEYKSIGDQTQYAEDLIIHCAKQLKIGPIARHLFGIFEKTQNLWLSPNEKLSNVNSTAYHYEFRVRHKPYSIHDLRDVDNNAFSYYFNQIRYDFLHKDPKQTKQSEQKEKKEKERILGLVIADMVRYSLEMKLQRDKALDKVYRPDFLPVEYAALKNPLYFLKEKQIKENFDTAWHCSQGNADYTKQEYMESIAFRVSKDHKPLLKDYGVEKYKAQKLSDANYSNQITAMDVEVQCHCNQDFGIFVCPKGGTLTKVCSIAELCFVSIQTATNTVEISRRNGTPLSLCFFGQPHLKSFVSCLDGLYRLSENWTFNLCREILSPSLEILRKLKCHGPVDNQFVYRKLKTDGKNEIGTYLIRESFKNYDEYFLDVVKAPGKFETYTIYKKLHNYVVSPCLNEVPKEYESIADGVDALRKFLEKSYGTSRCLRPSEFEMPPKLMLCRDNTELLRDKTKNAAHPSWPRVIPKNELQFCNQTWKMNANLEVMLAKLGNEEVVAKVIKNVKISQSFLETVSDWVKVKCDCIAIIHGVCLYSPLALVVEYLPHGPLDAFLVTNIEKLKVVDLIESISYAARALWYLEENNLVHGRIRCHNLLVSKYDASYTLKVKLSDPISDGCKSTWPELAWTAPEDEKTIAGDVWAFGTTVWEIFSYGAKPESENVHLLNQPFACPTEVWSLIAECWALDPHSRKQPKTIVRDINQLFYEVYNCRKSNSYAQPIYEKKPSSRSERSNFFRYFKSSKTLNSTETLAMDDDLMNNGGAVDARYSEEFSTTWSETWLIDVNHLKIGRQLGKGYYGEVSLATLTKWSNLATENVAVKRIKLRKNFGVEDDMRREINIMKKLRHENIVEIKGFVEDPELMLVMEYVELGSLVSYLLEHKNSSNRKESIPFLKFACDIAEGMEYLESKKVVHRDLAARNILVASPNQVKISDFGLAQIIEPENTYYKMKTDRDLPLKWYAPESIIGRRFSHKSDVWSYGVTLWQLYSYGVDPYFVGQDEPGVSLQHMEDVLELLKAGNRLSCPKDCPNSVYKLMMNCWKFEANDRPNFTSLKKSIKELMN